jgi:hypothetical protein
MRRSVLLVLAAAACGWALSVAAATSRTDDHGFPDRDRDDALFEQSERTLREGRKTFQSDTFGDEAFWGGALQLHQAIAGAKLGGVGMGLSPKAALGIGLKVDLDRLPGALVFLLRRGRVNLDDPATTLALLRLNAVVGVTGFFDSGRLTSVGIQCALCHSTVDNSFALGIGRRLDGWANRDLNVGAIIGFAPNLQPIADLLGVDVDTVKKVVAAWGPGKFDAELLLDGQGFKEDGVTTAATLIPPAFGLAGVNLHTWTGWGGVSHWNAFVANIEMGGSGIFYDPRLNDAGQFPVAARAGFGNIRNSPDRITPKLAALQFYQLALQAPPAPDDLFNSHLARKGKDLFNGQAQCSTCHVPPLFTEPGWNMHTAEEIGIDPFQADRAPDRRYRTAPLKGLWTHMKGGFYHDGRFATLLDVVNHYNTFLGLGLSDQQKRELVEYLKSL